MAEREYTPSQLKAIETTGRSLVVSAGAGSGKTTVLTERIIRGIKNGGDVDGILVVTFTKAAAADMKEKLYDALSKLAAEHPDDRKYAEMCLKISSARISTISSFCLAFVKENFEILGLSPRLRMADDGETDPLKEECLAETEEKAFEENDPDMILLADTLGGDKNFNKLNEILLELYGKFRAAPFWKNRFADAVEARRNEAELIKKEGFFASEAGKEIISDTLRKLNSLKNRTKLLLEYAENYATTEKHLSTLEKMLDDLTTLCENNYDNYNELKNAVLSFSAGRLYSIGMERDAVEYISNEKRAICDRMKKLGEYFVFTDDMINSDWEAEIRLCTALKNIIFKFDDAYTAAKNRRGICDYSDAEHLALKLLGKRTPGGLVRTELCRRYAMTIDEIYVDEYQDVNPLQDMIFSLLSRGNSFYVGDVKQSIYRFRNASAKIFGDRVKNASDIDGDGDTAKVFLRENFRSVPNVIEFINCVFEKLYTPENTGYDYEQEKLIYASKDKCNAPIEVSCISNVPSGKKDEYEAIVAASRIVGMVGHEQKCDKSLVEYKDIAVLIRSATGRVSEYERVFRENGIPFESENSVGFTERPEIMLAVSLLTVIDDPTDEIALAAVLRSPIFRLDAEELRLVRVFRPELPFYFAVSACAGQFDRKTKKKTYRCKNTIPYVSPVGKRLKTVRGKRPELETLKKCRDFIDLIDKLAYAAIELPSHKLIWKMYGETGLTELVGCFEHGDEKKNNLMKLYRLAVNYESSDFRGLSSFLDYLRNSGDKVEADVATNGNAVRIMTFHKSKGLEFPIVIVCGTGSKFNISDIRLPYVVCSDGFVCFDLRASGGLCTYQPLMKHAAVAKEKDEMLCEELRCLYVALTRAREQLYVVGCFDGDSEKVAAKEFYELGSNMERILKALHGCRSKCFHIDMMTVDMEMPDKGMPSPKQIKEIVKTAREEEQSVEWHEYDNIDACSVPAKVSVSELHPGLFEDNEYERSISKSVALKIPAFAEERKLTPAEMGTATHMFMQFCDFERVEKYGIKKEAEELVSRGLLTGAEADAVRVKELERFFGSELYRDMRRSHILKRELRFNLAVDSSLLGVVSGETVMVQGVIDCFFENEDGTYTVVDYKTDRLPSTDGEQILENRHKGQLSFYCRAVEEVTGKRVTRAILYSFALGKSVLIKYPLQKF